MDFFGFILFGVCFLLFRLGKFYSPVLFTYHSTGLVRSLTILCHLHSTNEPTQWVSYFC